MPRQSDLRFTVTAPAGDFEVAAFTLDEALSIPFRLHLELASFDPAIDFAHLLDQPLTLHIAQGSVLRHVHGLVSTLEQADTGHRRTLYRAVVEPALARLGLCSDWRIFQTLSVPQHGLTRQTDLVDYVTLMVLQGPALHNKPDWQQALSEALNYGRPLAEALQARTRQRT